MIPQWELAQAEDLQGFPLVLGAGRPTVPLTARLQTPARGDKMRLAYPGAQTCPPSERPDTMVVEPLLRVEIRQVKDYGKRETPRVAS